MVKNNGSARIPAAAAAAVPGQCLCGDIRVEIDFPARWAWHDHTPATRHAHGAAYATYVGSWRRRFRITAGAAKISRYEDSAAGTSRSFCARCGTPICYERVRSPQNAPFKSRTGSRPATGIIRRWSGRIGRTAGAAQRFPAWCGIVRKESQ